MRLVPLTLLAGVTPLHFEKEIGLVNGSKVALLNFNVPITNGKINYPDCQA